MALAGETTMEHICTLCRGRMKRLKETGDIFICEKCSHIEYVS